MDLFKKNLEALGLVHPQLAEALASLNIDRHCYSVLASPHGAPSLQISSPLGEKIFWHSPTDPQREAQSQVRQIQHDTMYVPLLAGIGLGHTLRCLYDQHGHEFTALIILERDPVIFRLALETTPVMDILQQKRVWVHVGDDLSQWPLRIREATPAITSCRLQVIQHPPSMRLYGQYYQAALNQVSIRLRTTQAEFDLMIRQGERIQKNLWDNLPKILKSIPLNQAKGLLQGTPAVVAAAGPSLDRNVHQLREAQSTLPIIAVDTAYRTLKKHGVEPHFVVASDPTELNLKHFEGISPRNETILAFDAETYGEIAARWPGRTLFINLDNSEYARWLERRFGPLGCQTKGGSVSNTAFFLARDMGADPIIFVGLDLAFNPQGGATHAADAALKREHGPIKAGVEKAQLSARADAGAMQENIVWVPGAIQEQVPTSKVMWIYIQQFAEQFAQTPAQVIDATEGGANIPGTEISTLQETLQRWVPAHAPVNEALARLNPISVNWNTAREAIFAILQELKAGEHVAQNGLQRSRQLTTQLAQGEALKASSEWQQMAQQFSTLYASTPIKIAMEQALFSAVYNFIQKEWPHEVQTRLQKYQFYFETYLNHSPQFAQQIQAVINQLKSPKKA